MRFEEHFSFCMENWRFQQFLCLFSNSLLEVGGVKITNASGTPFFYSDVRWFPSFCVRQECVNPMIFVRIENWWDGHSVKQAERQKGSGAAIIHSIVRWVDEGLWLRLTTQDFSFFNLSQFIRLSIRSFFTLSLFCIKFSCLRFV